MKKKPSTPKALDAFVDKVLRFKPPPKSKAAKKRAVQMTTLRPAEVEYKKAAD